MEPPVQEGLAYSVGIPYVQATTTLLCSSYGEMGVGRDGDVEIWRTERDGTVATGTLVAYLRDAGVGSRRQCFRLIQEERVTVNGVEAEAASMSVDPDVDAVLVDGKPVAGELRKVYLKVNKPRGVISTTWDDRGRRTVMSMTPRALRGMKLFPVGRLDADTTGLLLLTNDGELANGLMHPRYGVEKEYHVELDRGLSEEELWALSEGVVINGERTSEAEVNRLSEREGIWYSMVLREGRKRQIRLMLTTVGRTAKSIQRVRIHNLRLGRLPEGQVGELSRKEVRRLREVLARDPGESPPSQSSPVEGEEEGTGEV